MADDKKSLFKNALNFFQEGRWDKAIEEYKKILGIDPADVVASNMLGDCYVKKGQHNDAFKAYVGAADAYLKLGEQDKATQVYRKVISLNPAQLDGPNKSKQQLLAKNFEANKFIEQGLLDRAIAAYREIIILDPGNLDAYQRLGELCAQLGMREEAAQQFKVVAAAFLDNKLYRRALAMYQKVTELDPRNQEARIALAEIYSHEGMESEAKKEFLALAETFLANKQYDKAQQFCQKAIKLKSVEAHYLLGLVYFAKGMIGESKTEFEMLLKFKVNHVGALQHLGLVQVEKDDPDGALATFQKVLKLDDKNVVARQKLVDLHLKKGQIAEAKTHLFGAADLFVGKGSPAEAISMMRHFLDDPKCQDPDVWQRLGDLLAGSQKNGEAREAYGTAQTLFEGAGKAELAAQAGAKLQSVGGTLDAAPAVAPTAAARSEPAPATGAAAPAPAPAEVPPDVGGPRDETSMYMTMVDTYVQKGLLDEAIELCQKILELDPVNAEARKKLHKLYTLYTQGGPAAEGAPAAPAEPSGKSEADAKAEGEEKARRDAEEKAKSEAEAKANAELEAEAKAKSEAEAKEKAEAEEKSKSEAEARAKAEAEQKAKGEAEARATAEAELRKKIEEETRAKLDAEARAKAEIESKEKADAEARRAAEDETRSKAEAELRAKLDEERRAREEAEAKAKSEADARLKAEADERARSEAAAKAQAEADLRRSLEEEARAKAEAELRGKLDAERRAREEAEAKARAEADGRAQIEAEAKAKAEADARARAEDEMRRRIEDEARAKAEAELRDRLDAERKTRDEAEARANAEEEARRRAVASAPKPKASDSSDEFVTATVAEIYSRQGLFNEAIKIYQKILDAEPENAAVRKKMEDLKAQADARGRPAAAPPAPGATPAAAGGDADPFADMLSDFQGEKPPAPAKKGSGSVIDDPAAIQSKVGDELREKINPKDPKAQYDLGMLHHGMAWFDQALEAFQKAMNSDEWLLPSAYMAGVCLIELDRPDDAIEALKRGLGKKGADKYAYYDLKYVLAEAYEKKQMLNEASNLFREIYNDDKAYRDVESKVKEYAKRAMQAAEKKGTKPAAAEPPRAPKEEAKAAPAPAAPVKDEPKSDDKPKKSRVSYL